MRNRTLSMTAAALAAVTAVAMAPAIDDPAPAPAPEGCRFVDVEDTADDANDDVLLCEQQLFVRAGDAPLSNAASAVFSTEAPSAAPVGGAGLGSSVTDIALQGDPAHGLEVNGTFTGAVDTIDIEVWITTPKGDLLGQHGTTPVVEIDGIALPTELVVAEMAPPPSLTARVTFRVDLGLETWGLYRFAYDADLEHTLRLNLSPYYVGDDGAYLYDGTSVPSNVVLNAAQ